MAARATRKKRGGGGGLAAAAAGRDVACRRGRDALVSGDLAEDDRPRAGRAEAAAGKSSVHWCVFPYHKRYLVSTAGVTFRQISSYYCCSWWW